MKFRGAVKCAVNHVRQYGLSGYIQAKLSSRFDAHFERQLGVVTAALEENPVDGQIHPDQIAYVPISYSALIPVLESAGVGPSTHIFDYGCGAGRVLVTAVKLGTASATGVEFQANLVKQARANLNSVKILSNTRTKVIEGEAVNYIVPPETNLVFFFNPFIGKTLQAVIERIRESVKSHPRELTIVFFNDSGFRNLIAGSDWIRIIDQGVALSKTQWPFPWGIYRTGIPPVQTKCHL
jgi:SAM-dependent methyltransferase